MNISVLRPKMRSHSVFKDVVASSIPFLMNSFRRLGGDLSV